MGMFDSFFKKPLTPAPENNNQEKGKDDHKKEEYNPAIGDANRYENALRINTKLAEKINEEAFNLAKSALIVLAKIEKNPMEENLHSEISGKRWNIHYLQDVKKELLDLYGVSETTVNFLRDIPKEVVHFFNSFNELEERKISKNNESK